MSSMVWQKVWKGEKVENLNAAAKEVCDTILFASRKKIKLFRTSRCKKIIDKRTVFSLLYGISCRGTEWNGDSISYVK